MKALVLRSARPEVLDAVEEWCDCDWDVRAREERLVGEAPAIAVQAGQRVSGMRWE